MKTDQIESRIDKIETRIKQIDALFADPEVWKDSGRGAKLGEERQKLLAELEPLEFEWSQRKQ